MTDFLKWFAGKKTYIVAFAVAGVTFSYGMGFIDEGVRDILLGILGAGGLATLRHGMSTKKIS